MPLKESRTVYTYVFEFKALHVKFSLRENHDVTITALKKQVSKLTPYPSVPSHKEIIIFGSRK